MTLSNRLRGIYDIGPDAKFGTRSFHDPVPAINKEAADKLDELERVVAILTLPTERELRLEAAVLNVRELIRAQPDVRYLSDTALTNALKP